MKKIILTAFTAAILLLFSSPAYALFTVSAGVPFSHSFADTEVAESDGVSGLFLAAKLPIMVGVGIETYKTKLKGSTTTLATSMYDIFYQLPIPIVNLTLGLGMGSTELQCVGCSTTFDKGTATQWYTSVGIPIFPFFDAHLSLRRVSSKIKKTAASGGTEYDLGGTVAGIGIAFGF
ncbi:MAG: hypothetical protein H8E67_03260 [Proteobacteria bacterium]|jgi:hypothetical protein|nr:hypothetical protein [Pseudomonadota bacterium]